MEYCLFRLNIFESCIYLTFSVDVNEVHANRIIWTPNIDKIVLSWKYEPKNAAISKVECSFLKWRVYDFNSASNEGRAGDQYAHRVSHVMGAGFFNLTLKKPTSSDVGYYQCEFRSTSNQKIKKATLSLSGKQNKLLFAYEINIKS